MGMLDLPIGRVGRLSLGIAGSLISEVHRRGTRKPRRTPDRLLLEDASGLPGPALVEAIADFDMLLLPSKIDRTQAKELARAAGKAALDGAVERILETTRQLPRTVPRLARALATASWRRERSERSENDRDAPTPSPDSAELAAWGRFLAAFEKVAELRAAYAARPDDLAAEHLRWAEVELEDAVAIAGEFEVHQIRWLLT
jgi:hypothetical protein